MCLIEIDKVSKSFGRNIALEGVSLCMEEGEVHGLLGDNGAGKTTLLRLLTRILLPDVGTLRWEGTPLAARHVTMMGYLPEERGLYQKMRVEEHLLFLAQLRGMSRNDALQQVHTWLDRLALTETRNRVIEQLSKGTQQRIQFIAAIIHRPRILIADEPFSGLDPFHTRQLRNELLTLAHREGMTLFLSTHDMACVEEMCRGITLLKRGRVLLQGDLSAIKNARRGNRYRVLLPADTPLSSTEHYTVLAATPSWQGVAYEVERGDGILPTQLLPILLRDYEVLGFETLFPSMNEIYLSVSSQQNELS